MIRQHTSTGWYSTVVYYPTNETPVCPTIWGGGAVGDITAIYCHQYVQVAKELYCSRICDPGHLRFG